MTPAQFRMARAALELTVREIERETGVNKNTVSRIEAGKEVLASAFQSLEKFYKGAGIVFVEPDRGGLVGVLCRTESAKRVPKKRSQISQ